MIAALVGLALVHRVPVVVVLLAVGALWSPVPTGTVVLAVVAHTSFKESRNSPVDPVVGVVVDAAGALRAGTPLRAVVASGAFGEQLASAARQGLPIRAGSVDSLSSFGKDGPLVAATLDLAAETGGPVAAMFDRLAVGMVESDRTRRERRAAMAPVIAQATVVGGLPSLALVQMVVSGRWLDLLAGGTVSATLAVFGAVAVVVGVGWIIALVRGAR